MAAVLKYGSRSEQIGPMHPFFHTVRHDHHSLQTHSAAVKPCGLDGSLDNAETKPSSRSSSQHSDVDPGAPGNLTDSLDPSYSHAGLGTNANIVTDPNSDRRKRRKLTPVAPQGNTRQAKIVLPVQSDNTLDRPLQNNIINLKNDNDQSMDEAAQQLPNDPLPSDVAAHYQPSTPKKRTPRKVKKAIGEESIDQDILISGQGSDAGDEPKVTPSKKRGSTNRKKTISLHANGKLLSSPPAKDSLPNKEQASSSNQRASLRNVRMKNGRLVQSLVVAIKYGGDEKLRGSIGSKIDSVLMQDVPTAAVADVAENSQMHPFFRNKRKSKLTDNESESGRHHSVNAGKTADCNGGKEPVAWSDIKFSSQKSMMLKGVHLVRPIWPPLAIQHIREGFAVPLPYTVDQQSPKDAKKKSRVFHLEEREDVLQVFGTSIIARLRQPHMIIVPERRYITGPQMVKSLVEHSVVKGSHEAITSIHSMIVTGSSPFDRGECAGPNMWPLHYAPSRWSQVMQPAAYELHKWLKSLAVHNVQNGVGADGRKVKARPASKKKRRKIREELDDFIVSSDEEETEGNKNVKTALMITGPVGCGKTASVYAVAKELGFEVFEIHPGMRRSAKDIFDKVGDMAHNHLVQKGADLSRSSSVAPSDTGLPTDIEVEVSQTSLKPFFAGPEGSGTNTTKDAIQRVMKREQKQSLILFEEVDILFEDDKAFWTGVQSLIKSSKRPVIMTCNDLSSIPLDELNLHSILTFESIDTSLATEYLTNVAAAEGHIIERDTLSALYTSKANDLRASLTELNYWCQMTVGSKQGGLDWMGQGIPSSPRLDSVCQPLRLFSKGTFTKSLDLKPETTVENTATIQFYQDALGIPSVSWCDFAPSVSSNRILCHGTNLVNMQNLEQITEARSAMDLFDSQAATYLSSTTIEAFQLNNLVWNSATVHQKYVHDLRPQQSRTRDIVEALEAIMVEKPVFPPSQGRLAPSLDTSLASTATDIAPYVRAIVRYDIRLEQHREEVFGSQGKARNTRAARAAAEGGDKANTRTERWFPKDLDFSRALETAGSWPEWYEATG